MTITRWGVLSTASIGRKHVIPAITAAHNAEFRALASRSQQSAEKLIEEDGYKNVNAYGSYESLLQADDIDAVYIPLPNKLHFEWSKIALESGKDVLCEKPLTLSQHKAEELFTLADKTGNRVVEGFMYRHKKIMPKLFQVIQEELGQIHRVIIDFSFRTDRPSTDIRFQPDLGGGALRDVGCYCIDFVLSLLGKPDYLINDFRKLVDEESVDLEGAAVLAYRQAKAILTYSIASEGDKDLNISGEYGRISYPGFFARQKNGKESFYLHGGRTHIKDNIEEYSVEAEDLYRREIENISKAFQENTKVQPSPEESILNQRIIDKMIEADRKKEAVKC